MFLGTQEVSGIHVQGSSPMGPLRAVWPDACIICSIFGHFLQWTFGQKEKIPNLGSQFANYSMNAQRISKDS